MTSRNIVPCRRRLASIVACYSLGATLCCPLVCGCGGDKYDVVPVSGRVTLDGRPVSGARISFQPVASGTGVLNAGPGSYGKTDAKGHFTLRTVQTDKRGAVTGKHVVLMTTIVAQDNATDDAPMPVKKILPRKCFDGSMQFDVPEGGTDRADFELTSR